VETKKRDTRAQAVLLRAILLLAGALLFCSSGFANNEVFVHLYPLPAGGSFLLANINGSVQVDGWNRNEVEVRAVKSSEDDAHDLDAVKIDVESNPRQVTVHTRYPQGEGAEVAVEYHIFVPFHVLLGNIETVNGSVIVRGVNGGGELHSVNGDVEVLNSSGRFSAKTTNGDLHLDLRQLMDGGPMNIETVNGSVVLGLPSDARAELKVLSMNGDLHSDLPVTSTAGPSAAHAFRATLGTGGGQISVRTVNGGIRLVLKRPSV
jgi:DUF4097 and DUF4098 domain-containing protein YvlB